MAQKSSYNGYTEARKACNARYYESNGYVDFKPRFEKPLAEKIEKHSKERGESISEFLNRAFDETMARDLMREE